MLRSLLERLYGIYALTVFMVFALLFFCPLILIGPTLRVRRETGRIGMRVTLALMGVPFRVSGREHLPDGAAIIISNHASYVDGLVMTAALPSRYTFVVQDGAASWPYAGLVLKRMGVTFINRSSARAGAVQTRALIRRLQDGESFTIFAEGTFGDEAGLLPFKTGAFMMAAQAGVPVVPAGLRGTRRLFGEGRRLLRPSRIEVELGAPLKPAGDHKHAAMALRDAVRAQVLARCGEPDAARSASEADA